MKMLFLFTIWLLIAATQGTEESFSTGLNAFIAGVYKELTKTQSGSFMTSPLSVDILLAILHSGARGETARQLSRGLHLPEDQNKIGQSFTNVANQLRSTEHYELKSANKIFLRNGFDISSNFKSRATRVFGADIQNIDFSRAQAAASEINRWVEGKTNNKIHDLVTPNDLGGNPAAVLINALYFRGKWETEFVRQNTKKKDFHRTVKNKVQVNMMEIQKSFRRYDSERLKAKFLEMPYKGDGISITFVLPNEIEGLPALEQRIDEVLAMNSFRLGQVIVKIPKFTIESTIHFNSILRALGIDKPFTTNADFTGIGANRQALYINKVIQKSFIEIDEEGTRAAVASAGTINFLSLKRRPTQEPMKFNADHPFLYFIKRNDIVVFIGRYCGP